MAINSTLIDGLIDASVNIVYQGFLITSGILEYLVANYVTAIAGLVVLGLLLGLIWAGTKKANPLSEVKSMTKF